MTHRWIEARGSRFHVAEAGAGEDVVLCLHGWPQHWYEWRHLMPALADRHRILALDLRGFGWSDAPRESKGYEKEELAGDVLAVLDALGIERVKLVGHDWGGWIGFLLCLRAPERITHYLAMGILTPWVDERRLVANLWRFSYQPLVASPFVGYRLHTSGTLVPKVLVGASEVRSVWDAETIAAFTDSFKRPDHARAAVQVYRTFLLREQPAIKAGRYARERLFVPTRMLMGAQDPLGPELLAGWGRHADDMELELVEGCGHFVADEAPALLAERARAFLG